MQKYSRQRIDSMTTPERKSNLAFNFIFCLIFVGLTVGGIFAYGEFENQQLAEARADCELVAVANYAGTAESGEKPIMTYEWRKRRDRNRPTNDVPSADDSLPQPETVSPPRRRRDRERRPLFDPNRKRIFDGGRLKAVGIGLMWLAGGLLAFSMVGLHIKSEMDRVTNYVRKNIWTQ